MFSMPRAASATPVLLLIALLAGCSGGRGGAGSDAASPSGSGAELASKAQQHGQAPQDASPAKQAAAVGPLSRAVISTGQLSMHSRTIDEVRAEVIRLVASWNGMVADEQTSSDRRGRIVDSTMTLRVPTPEFDEAMRELARLGAVDEQSRTSEDVTTKVLDNAARVRAAERSIRQIELLLGRAEQLSDIITIESDLARRQADLDSLKSQQAWLEDQTSLSTVTVRVHRTEPTPPRHDAHGFLAGLGAGWNALVGGTVLVLTAVGAALPFAVLGLLLGLPLWIVLRRRLAALSAGSAPARSA